MSALSLLRREILARLAAWEFRWYKDNRHVFFRERYLRALGVEFTRPISVGLDFYLRDPGQLKVGSHASFGSFTRIWNYAPIEIGDHFLSAGGLTINTGTHDPVTLQPSGAPVRIGHRVWVGVNVTILAGVTIGDDVVIGAGSVVTSDLPSATICAGVPARKIRDLDRREIPEVWGAWGPITRNP